ncbi:MAG: hypothetical protein A3A96_01815 [Candidatus Zambryskibacteria bacterium RIFCSPLOWO2_01_FULL_39_39]|uniref:Uncharacterized protein n=1 Tax=Candidatus Zambryskibacteria bacterium RIFCSPLOWO2_01_FULL_39_39 TaxID=1802758 RepID=A0A1G2TXR6_9BACT|nr:MAG: hypothetical protein UT00_C0005G0012 [Parcubacteria group bacterium GW2011_GWA1_38_7]OHA86589.1 MAG: hypothetical protein A2644_01930 [Candidatus Zambryskibacteria bacterium RIFCSPHIGHO2_01_FULL_39_63]OHA94242.1 MAG: hypothetical protein A3B88_03785 [Candidatus Zambryskibacteria bacterium RIFCSPHIGHO2_02_FULL_39_19]OHA98491.1 MAG: hypothetical protein A3F20_03710 [Candidatus Zambryskibacteria bacterium RIFCSPHIGHO2_12_FULL_39_21]OHB01410.1 MAG: hypothetical protein A3A96_01815 [Candidat
MADIIKQKTKSLVMHKITNYALAFFIFALAFSYIYFANLAVRNLTILEKTKDKKQSLSVTVSEMESKRLSIENTMNMEKTLSLGFVEVENPIFIMKSAKKTTLSLKID